MENNRASKRFTIIIFVLTAAMIAFAFVHSLMPATVSGEESGSVMELINSILHSVGLSLSEHTVRKLAHFSEYTAIGGLLLSCAYCFDRKKPHRYLSYIALVGLGTPFADETIQLFVDGRAGMLSDVWLDFCGVCTGVVLMLVVYSVYRRIKNI